MGCVCEKETEWQRQRDREIDFKRDKKQSWVERIWEELGRGKTSSKIYVIIFFNKKRNS